MMWMGALLDISTKRSKIGVDDQELDGVAGLRTKMVDGEEENATPPEKLEKFVCSNCYSTNTQVGPCFNCGTVIEAPVVEAPPEDAKGKAAAKVAQLQKKYGLTNKQLIIAAGVVVGLPLMGLTMCHEAPAPVVPGPPGGGGVVTEHKPPTDKMLEIATKFAGFKGTAPPGYWYEDTTDLTKPQQSFGLYSDQSNQKIIFIVNDDMSPVNDLANFVGKPPYTDANATPIKDARVDEGSQILGDGNLHWFIGHYSKPNPDSQEPLYENILTAAYQSPVKGKSIIVVGRPLKDTSNQYDYKTTLWLCDQMAEDYTALGNNGRTAADKTKEKMVSPNGSEPNKPAATEEKPVASDEDIDAFVTGLQPLIQEKLKIPDDIQDLLKKHKPPKIRTALTVGIAEDGTVTKLEISKPGDYDSATAALTKAVNACAPFAEVPHTKAGSITVLVSLSQDKIKVEKP
jgi:hypothetical protein